MSSTNTKTYPLNETKLWTALVTPFLPNGDIDFNNLAALAQQQSDAGNGITLLGSTGEGLALTHDEQWAIVKFICDLSLSVPIMVAVGGYQQSKQFAWIEQCNKLLIDSYLLTIITYLRKTGSCWLNSMVFSLA